MKKIQSWLEELLYFLLGSDAEALITTHYFYQSIANFKFQIGTYQSLAQSPSVGGRVPATYRLPRSWGTLWAPDWELSRVCVFVPTKTKRAQARG